VADFKCWDAEHDQTEDDAESVTAFDARSAAEIVARKRFCKNDYPTWQTFHVRDEDGSLRVFEVETETVPHFHAREIKASDSARNGDENNGGT